MALTQRELALQMLAQIRMLDPSVSAEVGTPERKILDTVAQALSDAQVDFTQLSGALDIDSKSGADLERFLALFGFGRQTAASASGFVTFSRPTASTLDIRIPARTQVIAPGTIVINPPNDTISDVVFETTFEVTLLAGQTSVIAPISATLPGSSGNMGAGRITQFAGTVIYGITDITNDAPTTGGVDGETDEQLKVRFKNTIFRNLAGTQDQFLALAASTKYTTKANVVGPISRYREYVQVPPVDDMSSYNVNPEFGANEAGNGLANQYTTALSDIPYSKHIYTEVPNFVSNGQTGTNLVFWREEIDWILNSTNPTKNRGDAYRFFTSDILPELGIDPMSSDATYKPNITFLNVYTGANVDVTAIRPEEVVLFEHSYMSTASRNDWTHGVTNCVDVFIDGANDTVTSTVIPAPGASTATAFVNDTLSKYHFDNYRLWGEPDIAPATWTTTPAAGGTFQANRFLFLPMFWQPTTGLPDSIVIRDDVTEAIYFLNEHYWLVYDDTELFGTVRARNGICWDKTLHGAISTTGPRTANALQDFTNPDLSISIDNYLFDKNVIDLQSSIEASKQVTTDILVHRARRRYLKLDITVMYEGGANVQDTNNQIRDNVARYFNDLYFGNVIQLSDILQSVHAVSGVDNVRWSSDIPGSTDLARVYETNRTGVERGDSFTHATDFYVMDDELPALAEALSPSDQTGISTRKFLAVPGLIIRTRAQNTFIRA